MRVARVAAGLVTLAVIAIVVVLAVGRLTGAGSKGYMVRAIFENSSFVIAGEDVRVAGVTVGTIQAVQLTPDNRAALVLQINNRRFEPFRTDAHCEIGLESLLGEQFVQCTPTQPRASSAQIPAPLPAIRSGPDQGQHVLPITDTTTPVGLDLLNNIMRLPQRERLRLIIAGLGAGLDGNGRELNAALRRADPALQETDRVIAVLASENRTLARLTDESAQVLAPLAAQRAHLGGLIRHAGTVAAASAQEAGAIQQNLADFPPFLRQLKPAADRLNHLATQMTPALQSLASHAPAINAALKDLGPLATSSVPALKSLGNVARRGETVFPKAHAVAAQLLALGRPLLPLSTDLAAVAQSFDNAGGIEDVMRFIYYYTGSVNGEDSLGHYIRSRVALGNIQRRSAPQGGPSVSATWACSLLTSKCPANGSAAAARALVNQAVSAAGKGSSAAGRTLLSYLLSP